MIKRLCVILAIVGCATPALGEGSPALPGIQAHLRPKSYYVPVGAPMWVNLTLENATDKPITLTVPGTEPDIPLPEMGLPLAHVFSGPSASGVSVTTQTNRRWETPAGYRFATSAPILMIAPRSTVGTLLNLTEYFPSLRSPGEYRLQWSPYGGGVQSNIAVVHVTPLKRAEFVTDEGTLTMRLYYEDAPQSVANFIDLVQSGFYTGKAFHRLEQGYFIQGGCPRGDGTGIRPDGKRVPAEFNERPHEKGSVSMALLDDDADSASCQFFICNTRQKEWDAKYTVFGHLVGDDSLATLDRLMVVPADEHGSPTRSLVIRSARLIAAPTEPTSNLP